REWLYCPDRKRQTTVTVYAGERLGAYETVPRYRRWRAARCDCRPRHRTPLVLGRVRREQARQDKGHGRQDGVGQPAHLDPHRRDRSGREGGTLDSGRWRAERAAPPRLDEELAALRHRDHRRRLPGEGRFEPRERT